MGEVSFLGLGHPSAADRAQDRESSPARDRRSTTVLRHQASRPSKIKLAVWGSAVSSPSAIWVEFGAF